MKKILPLVLALSAAAWLAPATRAEDPKPKTEEAKPKRTADDVQKDLQAASMELRESLNSPEVLIDAAKRKEAAPKAIPVMKRMASAFDELAALEPRAKDEAAGAKLEFLTMLSIFGDAESITALDKLAQVPDKGTDAKAAQLFVTYVTASKDEAAQLKTLDEVQKLAKAQPKNDVIAQTLIKMAQMGAATPAVTSKAEDILTTDCTGEFAMQAGEGIKGERKMRNAVDKPVDLAGTTIDGTKFTTSKDMKGKVILVDFWATWCGPCLKELPRVKKAYIDYHAKGLEVLGVTCDSDVNALKEFLDKNKDMPWPQLFDTKENPKLEWSPLAKEWGINGIPTMFLIDKKGILRSVKARENFEEMIPKLLEEKAE